MHLNDLVLASGWTLFHDRVWIFPAMAAAGDYLNSAASLGDVKVARMMLCLFLAFPLALVTPSLPRAWLRHLWCLVLGVFFVQCVFGVGWLHLLLPSTAVYCTALFFRATGLLPGLGHWVAAFISFSYLLFRHLSRNAAFSNGIDDSTLSMVMVVKLYTLCYNLYDAEAAAASASASAAPPPPSSGGSAILEKRRLRAVPDFPSPLEYFAYVFNFSTVFGGPAFEFGEYRAAQQQFVASSSSSSAAALPLMQQFEGGALPAGYLGTRFLPGLWKLAQGIVWMGVAVVVQAAFRTDDLFKASQTEPSTAQFVAFLLVAVTFSRYKYYAIWKLSEGAAVLAGFGFRGPRHMERRPNPAVADLEVFLGLELRELARGGARAGVDSLGLGIPGLCDWEGASNCNPVTVETRVSMQDFITNWNMHVQSWLANYVMLRIPREAGVGRLVTFLASAFWHGLYPGYYIMFITMWLFQDTARAIKVQLERVVPGVFDKAGTIVGPQSAGGPGKRPVYAWPSPLRFLLWLLQWGIQVGFLAYGSAAFVMIGNDPHCSGGELPSFCGGSQPPILTRINAVYARMHYTGHWLALGLYAATLCAGALGSVQKPATERDSKKNG